MKDRDILPTNVIKRAEKTDDAPVYLEAPKKPVHDRSWAKIMVCEMVHQFNIGLNAPTPFSELAKNNARVLRKYGFTFNSILMSLIQEGRVTLLVTAGMRRFVVHPGWWEALGNTERDAICEEMGLIVTRRQLVQLGQQNQESKLKRRQVDPTLSHEMDPEHNPNLRYED